MNRTPSTSSLTWPQHLVARVESERAPEWLYVFKPEIAGAVLYLKLIVRADCVVISFDEDEGDGDEDA